MAESKLHFWLRLSWVVAYVLMLVAALNHLLRLNTDAIAYMRVAEYWSTGNFDFAVNGYWGPLLSWLMVPFLWLGVSPLFAGKMAMLISGGVFFHGSLFLVRAVGLRLVDELILAFVLALMIPGWMAENVTPDLLVAGLMAFALGQAVSQDWLMNRWRSLGGGATWGLAYLAKAVALPVGVVASVLLALCWRLGQAENRSAVWRQLGQSLGLFALVSLPWIVVLSLKCLPSFRSAQGRPPAADLCSLSEPPPCIAALAAALAGAFTISFRIVPFPIFSSTDASLSASGTPLLRISSSNIRACALVMSGNPPFLRI